MKSTKGGFAGAGQFDTKSHMSGVTGASRASDPNNAYLYATDDQSRMQDINSRLQSYNPSLVGSSMMSNDNFDTEAQIIPAAGRREKFSKNRLNDLPDDTRSVMSFESGVSVTSRKSGISLLDMGSILSLGGASKVSGKLPGAKGLK